MAKTDNKQAEVDVVVANGRTVDHDGQVFGQGASLTLPLAEAKWLYEKGFVVEPEGERDDGDEVGSAPSVQIAEQGQ